MNTKYLKRILMQCCASVGFWKRMIARPGPVISLKISLPIKSRIFVFRASMVTLAGSCKKQGNNNNTRQTNNLISNSTIQLIKVHFINWSYGESNARQRPMLKAEPPKSSSYCYILCVI